MGIENVAAQKSVLSKPEPAPASVDPEPVPIVPVKLVPVETYKEVILKKPESEEVHTWHVEENFTLLKTVEPVLEEADNDDKDSDELIHEIEKSSSVVNKILVNVPVVGGFAGGFLLHTILGILTSCLGIVPWVQSWFK
ncbi:hypothetical protein L596_009311 [Steinernema carpocapsae]|uniref:Uncharacterized protein n=1 Tax=Steinernema carpocapsae TaxID=34508 RepID=A0A4U5PFE0_STECR|nr:hypothetical protein L596_009311 [Steinernema carpocapsae]